MDEGSSFEFQLSLVVYGFCFGVEKCPGLGVRDGLGLGEMRLGLGSFAVLGVSLFWGVEDPLYDDQFYYLI